MTEEKIYVCDYCGSKYDTEDDALECENRHKKLSDILEYDYDKYERTPERIKLSFEDDISCWYRREE